MAINPDVTLTDGTTTLELEVFVDPEDKALEWAESELPFLVPRQGFGEANYANKNPEDELVEVWETWHLGFGEKRQRRGYYTTADGIDARFSGQLGPSPKVTGRDSNWFLARNMNAEDSSIDDFSNVNSATHSRDTSIKRSGSASWKVNFTGTSHEVIIALANPTVYQGLTLTFVAYIRSDGTNATNISIQDSVGQTQSSSTTSTSFTRISVTRSINGSATSIDLMFTNSASATWSAHFDDCYAFVGDPQVRGATEFKDSLYIAVGQGVAKWDGTDTFDYVALTASTCSDVEAHDGNIYAAFGTTTPYEYSSDGSSWTASNRTTPDDEAVFFQSVGGSANLTLWKKEDVNIISSSDDGVNSGTAWTNYTVGGSDRAITQLYGYQNGPVVGREDGLWVWDATNSDFDSVMPEFATNPAATNFDRGIAWNGWLYVITARQGVIRYATDGNFSHTIQSLGATLLNPTGLTDYGGRVVALAADSDFLYLLVDTPQTETNTKTVHLMTLQESLSGGSPQFLVHTIKDVTMSQSDFMYVFNNQIWLFGRLLDTGSTYYDDYLTVDLPTDTINPARAKTPKLETTGTIDFSIWDADFRADSKLILKWIFSGENIDSSNHYELFYRRKGESSFTSVGTFNSLTDGEQTLTAKVQISTAATRASLEWEWRLKVTYDGSGVAPICTSLVVRALVRFGNTPRQFRFAVDIDASGQMGPQGAIQHLDPRTVYEQLRTWEDTATALTLTDMTGKAFDVILRPVLLRKVQIMPDEKERLVIEMIAREVKT